MGESQYCCCAEVRATIARSLEKNMKPFLRSAILAGFGAAASAAPVAKNLDRVLHFEAAPERDLVVKQPSGSVVLSPGEATLQLIDRQHRRAASVTAKFAGASASVRPQGEGLLAARANYLLGSDPAAWRTEVPLYSRAIYRDVYPGIDLVFYGADGSLEYDFTVRPGGDPRRIQLDIGGAQSLAIDQSGSLVMGTAAGRIVWKTPRVYQMRDGVRRPVEGAFRVRGRRVSFALGAFDAHSDLVIDPAMTYATYQGGSENDAARGVAVDASGNIYVTGFTESINLPHTGGSLQPAFHGAGPSADIGGDAFIAKYTSAGALVYVTYLGGAADEAGGAIAVDSSGSAYVAGYTSSKDFPSTTGRTYGGGSSAFSGLVGDAFAAKLNPAGTALVYSTYLGGSGDDFGTAIAIDASGNAYVGGSTASANFPVAGAAQSKFGGSGGNPNLCSTCSAPVFAAGDGFVAKLNGSGIVTWATYLGGSFDDAVAAIAVDSQGNAYAGGSTISANFPTLGAYQSVYGGTLGAKVQPQILVGDGFITKYDTTGKMIYSTYLGGSGDEMVMGLAVDSTGAAYASGFTSSANLAPPAVLHGTFHGPNAITGSPTPDMVLGDAFVAKLAPSGSSLVYATYIGGSKDDAGLAVAVDGAGEAIVGGFSNSSDMQLSSDALQKKWGGSRPGGNDFTGDGFVARISADGATVMYNSFYGGSFDDAIASLAIDASGNVVAVGSTTSRDLPLSASAAQKTFGGEDAITTTEALGDAFVAVFSGLTSSAPPGPVITSVQNGATYQDGFPSGAWLQVQGTNLASVPSDTWDKTIANGVLPQMLDNVKVSIGGQPGYVYFVSPGQINVVAPSLTPGPTQVVVTNSLGTSAAFNTNALAEQPGFFPWPGGYAVATHYPDYSYAIKNGAIAGLATTPAHPGDVIILWGTGFGPTSPAAPLGMQVPSTASYGTVNAVTVTVGNVAAQVYGAALAPGFAALYQVAIEVPPGLADGDYPVVATVAGASSPVTTLLTVKK